MILGVLLSAMFAGGVGSLILFSMDAPLWMILAAYPCVGTTVLLRSLGSCNHQTVPATTAAGACSIPGSAQHNAHRRYQHSQVCRERQLAVIGGVKFGPLRKGRRVAIRHLP
jgi:hypothetical protein